MSILYNITASSWSTIFYILVSFGFVIGIILMISPKAFDTFNEDLKKEYGIKKRFIPEIEDTKISVVDEICMKNATIAGMLISVASFILLLIYR